jgi:hypothetical protein
MVVPQPARHRHRVNDVVELPLSLRSTKRFMISLRVLVHPEVRKLPTCYLSQRQEGVELQPVALGLLGQALGVAYEVALGYIEAQRLIGRLLTTGRAIMDFRRILQLRR